MLPSLLLCIEQSFEVQRVDVEACAKDGVWNYQERKLGNGQGLSFTSLWAILQNTAKAPVPGVAGASSNWAQLKKTLSPPAAKAKSSVNGVVTKHAKVVKVPGPRAKLDKGKARAVPQAPNGGAAQGRSMLTGVGRFMPRPAGDQGESAAGPSTAAPTPATIRAGSPERLGVTLLPLTDESALVVELREMVAGRAVLNAAMQAPGNYVAIDCEMVGLGPGGSESALARVSLVNFHGHVLLDTYVMPRESVTDWRSWVSGIRERDLRGAPSFDEVQRKVAEIVEGRIVVGHAIQNDLRILLLSHPGPLVRDTQKCPGLREKAKTKFPGLKKLAALELGVEIQSGAHSSVTDARVTMALYRLHKNAWEQTLRPQTEAYRQKVGVGKGEVAGGGPNAKRKRSDSGAAGGETAAPTVKGGTKGVSVGIGVVIHRKNGDVKGGTPKRAKVAPLLAASGGGDGGGKWWEQSAS